MSDTRINSYAAAFVQIAESESVTDRVMSELRDLKLSLETSDQLRSHLTDEMVPADRRQKTIESLLSGKAHNVTAQLVSMAFGAGRGRDLPAIIDLAVKSSSSSAGLGVAEVRSAVALSDDQQKRLADALSKATGGQPISLKVIVDPSVVGGLVATVGDQVIDGSVRNRLDQLKSRL